MTFTHTPMFVATTYFIGGEILESYTEIRDLGVVRHKNLNLIHQVQSISAKDIRSIPVLGVTRVTTG